VIHQYFGLLLLLGRMEAIDGQNWLASSARLR
jgi:hypothetical protein